MPEIELLPKCIICINKILPFTFVLSFYLSIQYSVGYFSVVRGVLPELTGMVTMSEVAG